MKIRNYRHSEKENKTYLSGSEGMLTIYISSQALLGSLGLSKENSEWSERLELLYIYVHVFIRFGLTGILEISFLL